MTENKMIQRPPDHILMVDLISPKRIVQTARGKTKKEELYARTLERQNQILALARIHWALEYVGFFL